jgi:rubrerythrin
MFYIVYRLYLDRRLMNKEMETNKISDIQDIEDAIRTAIQMEKDGYSFYQKAAAQTSSDMGKTVFKGLAADELLHLEIFKKIFENKVGKNEWFELVNTSKKYSDSDIFPKDLQKIEGANPDTNEIDALRIAMDSEQRAIDYYSKIREKITDDEIKKIIDEIIAQEKNHYLVLEGEFHHINSTGYWFDLDYLGPI